MKIRWPTQSPLSASIIVALCLLASFPALFDRPLYRLYGPINTETNKGFRSNGEPRQGDLPDSVVRDPQTRFWRNWSPEAGVAPGYLRTAPLALMEGDLSEPAYPAGFGPGRFYDIAGFIENGRWARFTQPYFDQLGPIYRLDSVGCCYLVNADLYRWGAKHELDHASKAFIAENRAWPDDAITQNQLGPANSYTDHYTVCEFAREVALPVQAFADLIAYHKRA